MIRAANLLNRLAHILAARGKTADFTRDVLCVDDSDGQPPRLAHWDSAKLGPMPTQAEVDAASDGPTKEQHNAPILAQIEALEAKQRRPIREHILGHGPDAQGKVPAQRVKEIDDAIKVLRAQLR